MDDALKWKIRDEIVSIKKLFSSSRQPGWDRKAESKMIKLLVDPTLPDDERSEKGRIALFRIVCAIHGPKYDD